ncbi:MAG: YigZ family protein [Malacoplasma sp.]|nr:YigZ family protein [Malacoplasma sp.]
MQDKHNMKKIVNNNSQAYFQIEGSKFYAFGFQIDSEKKVIEIIKNLWKEHKKAVHICYGFILKQKNYVIEKFNDDKEPKNSAGKKILSALQNENFTNSLIAVVRYKTKSLLGIGLLSRSYYKVSEMLLKNEQNYLPFYETEIITVKITNQKVLSDLLNLIKIHECKIINLSDIEISFEIEKEKIKFFEKILS